MRGHLKPVVTLLAITPFLTELLSNNLPPSVFFKPLNYLFLATIGYGFPVLLLREWACTKRMGLAGLLCLGFAYGIINEGILAKTYFLSTHVPIGTFDNYGRWWGISVPWAITITVWHAFHSLCYPILMTYYFFPGHREERWLSRRGALWLFAVTALLSAAIFFTHSPGHPAGSISRFAFLVGCMGLLALGAAWISGWTRICDMNSPRLKPILRGAGAPLLLLLLPVLMSGAKVSPPALEGYFALALFLIFRWLWKHREASVAGCVLFAAGDDLMLALLALLGAVHARSLEKICADLILIAVFAVFASRVRIPQLVND